MPPVLLAPALAIRAPSAPPALRFPALPALPARAKALLSALNAYPAFVTDERHAVVRHGGIKTAVLAVLSFVLVVSILSWLFTVGYTVTTVVENPTLAQYDAISARQPSCPCGSGGVTTLGVAADLNPAGYAATHSMARSLCGAITRLLAAAQAAGWTQGQISAAFPWSIVNTEAAFVQNEIVRGVGGFCYTPSYSEALSLQQAQSTVVPLDFLGSRTYIQSLAAQVYRQYFMNVIILSQSMAAVQSEVISSVFYSRMVRRAQRASPRRRRKPFSRQFLAHSHLMRTHPHAPARTPRQSALSCCPQRTPWGSTLTCPFRRAPQPTTPLAKRCQ